MAEIVRCEVCTYLGPSYRTTYHQEGRCPNVHRNVVMPLAPIHCDVWKLLGMGRTPSVTVQTRIDANGKLTSRVLP